MTRSRRLNIPLPVMRPHGQRHESPFYRPAPHSNAFSDPDKDYDKLRPEARQNRGEDSGINFRIDFAWLKRAYRRHKRLGSDYNTALHKAGLDYLDRPEAT